MSAALEARVERLLGALSLRIALGSLALVMFLIAWNRGVALLYGMFALLVAALLVGFIAPRFNLRGIAARRSHAATAHEGDPLHITVELAAPRRRYMLEVMDRLPFAAEDQQTPFGFVPRLAGLARLGFDVTCDLRGVHRLGPIELRTAYPLGIYRQGFTLPGSESEVVVYPRPFPIRSLPLLGASQSPIAGARAASVAGGGDEPFGVREYRRGDSPRHIHWAISARRGELVVREYELVHRTDLLIVLDLQRRAQFGEGRHSTLEYAVKIAASCARYALDEGHGVGITGYGAHSFELPVGRGPQHYQQILELLARVQADGDVDYADAVRRALARLPQGGVALLFDIPPLEHGHAEARLDVQRHHVRPLWVRFDSESFEFPLRRSARGRPAGPELYYVRRGDDLTEIFAR